jgi:hypothetical protein
MAMKMRGCPETSAMNADHTSSGPRYAFGPWTWRMPRNAASNMSNASISCGIIVIAISHLVRVVVRGFESVAALSGPAILRAADERGK